MLFNSLFASPPTPSGPAELHRARVESAQQPSRVEKSRDRKAKSEQKNWKYEKVVYVKTAHNYHIYVRVQTAEKNHEP
jgi:hypothetical protein